MFHEPAVLVMDLLHGEGTLAENWKDWFQRFKIYVTASGIAAKSEGMKSVTMLHLAGESAMQVFNSWANEGNEKKCFSKVKSDRQ